MDGLPVAVLLAIFVIAGIFLVIVAYEAFRIREVPRRVAWGEVAGELGLTRVDGRSFAGRIDGFEVTLVVPKPKSDVPKLELRVSGGLPAGLALGGKATVHDGPEGAQPLGEMNFDDACWVRGDERSVLSTLDDVTREGLMAATDLCWRFEDRVCRVEWLADPGPLPGGPAAGAEGLRKSLQRTLALAKALRKSEGDEVARIVQVAASDWVPGLRERALRWLLSHQPEHPAVRRVLQAKLNEPYFGIRLMAAETLGHLETLVGIVRGAGEPYRSSALLRLVQVEPDHDLTREAVTHALRAKGLKDRSFREAALTHIEERFLSGLESALIELLDIHDDDLRRHVMRVLGAVGTLAAVPALLPFRDMFIGFSLKDAAKDAVAAIQARAKVPGHGSLALAEEGGQLALVALGARTAGAADEEGV